jgi:glycine cleavage system H protein
MDFQNMRFTKEHEWVAVEDGSDVVTIGITEYAAGELGDIVFVELPEVGTEVKNTEPMGSIEAVKTVADLFAPLSGVVKDVNPDLENNPGLVNESPFDKGWFAKIEMSNRSEFEELMSREDYDKMIGKE